MLPRHPHIFLSHLPRVIRSIARIEKVNPSRSERFKTDPIDVRQTQMTFWSSTLSLSILCAVLRFSGDCNQILQNCFKRAGMTLHLPGHPGDTLEYSPVAREKVTGSDSYLAIISTIHSSSVLTLPL